MKVKKLLVALLVGLSACFSVGPPAEAKIIYVIDGEYSYYEGGFGYGGTSGSWDTNLPDVIVECKAVCQGLGGVSYINATQVVRIVSPGPIASPSADGNGVPDSDPVKAKMDCVANCAIQRTIHDNNCTIQAAQLRTKLSNMPAVSAISAGVVSRWLRKKIGGDVDTAPIWGAAAYGAASSEIDRKISDFNAGCAAMGAKAQNDCITGTCKALIGLPILFFARSRRRAREDDGSDVSMRGDLLAFLRYRMGASVGQLNWGDHRKRSADAAPRTHHELRTQVHCHDSSSSVRVPPVRNAEPAGSLRSMRTSPMPGQYHSSVVSGMSRQPLAGSA
ncbi:hypothetical protein RFUL19S_03494 [Rhizobacter fulvus]